MTGSVINVVTILVGSLLGLLIKSRLNEKLKSSLVVVLGLFTLGLGVKMFLDTSNVLVVLLSMLIGTLIGELLRIDDGLTKFGEFMQRKFSRAAEGETNTFAKGLLTATLLYAVGPVAFLGAIQDGLTGDYSLLAVKSLMDGVSSMALAATLGMGVLFSAVPVFLYQAGISLLAGTLQGVLSTNAIAEISAVGGVILLGIGISMLLDLKHIRTANFLPALLLAPLVLAVFAALGLY